MRVIFGILGLLVTVASVSWLAKTQLTSTRHLIPLPVVPASEVRGAVPATVREQAQQIQNLVRQPIDAAQPLRDMPDER